ncbi:MAG TPA: GNAT family protein [Acidimicrobiales bacterium]
MSQTPTSFKDWLTPVVLENEWVRLEPLSLSHVQDLAQVTDDAEIWRWLPVVAPKGTNEVRALVQRGLEELSRGERIPFAVIRAGVAVGTTSFLDLSPEHRSVEIGWTWYGQTARRTATNTASKRLLLGYAFDAFRVRRVAFKTDVRNTASNTALLRIGATYEGALRSHRVLPDGSRRDSAYYSILDTEWPRIRRRLDQTLASTSS